MIKILPPRLANQIAAGEVVERPSSVVKELIENSLDAGADKITLDVEKGGHKLIRVSDNGKGVNKEELQLALSRHATSKISSLDDLEAIVSLGFRGEALASISSVSRLTFTSKPEQQQQAWQAVAEGRDMTVALNPVAHPKGTSVEVWDLFFNTPARRKFLRTEKTEFSHIDETVKRIALSRSDVQFILTHNGKVVRRYNKADTEEKLNKRIAAVCGNDFVQHSLKVKSEHAQLCLSGWLAEPAAARKQNDCQYFYVNGRMMRDKVINHAIRQAFSGILGDELYPAFVLYLTLPADQVDVNVHPAKHEVRFHQSRLIHDFICQVLSQALQSLNVPFESVEQHVTQAQHDYQPAPLQVKDQVQERVPQWQQPPSAPASNSGNAFRVTGHQQSRPSEAYQQAYKQIMTPASSTLSPENVSREAVATGPRVLSLIEQRYALVDLEQTTLLLDAYNLFSQSFAEYFKQDVVSQPLLMPMVMNLQQPQQRLATEYQQQLESLGFHYLISQDQLILRQVPAKLRQQDHALLMEKLLVADIDLHTAVCQFAVSTQVIGEQALEALLPRCIADLPNGSYRILNAELLNELLTGEQ